MTWVGPMESQGLLMSAEDGGEVNLSKPTKDPGQVGKLLPPPAGAAPDLQEGARLSLCIYGRL